MAESNPPVLLVSGTDGHRRRQFVRSLIRAYESAGAQITSLTGDDHAGIAALVDSTGVLFSAPTLAVVRDPEKLKADDLAAHVAAPDPALTFLLVSEQDKPAGPGVEAVPAGARRSFSLPPSYKLEGHAADYAVAQARAAGLYLPAALAAALVRRVGAELGCVHYEIDKAVTLARARGVRDLTPELLRDTVSPLAEMDGSVVVEALSLRDPRRVAEELDRYYQSKKGDPTIELCGRVLSPTALRWFQAAHLAAAGLSPTVAAGRVGANPWYWENKVLPPARAWGTAGCRELLGVVARAQEAVFSGQVGPWRILVAGLLRLTP